MATALELTREGWQPYLKGALRRSPSPPPSALVQHERERILGLVRKAADVLKIRFRARRVILFGSLARIESFHPRSDVDLAVEGLTGMITGMPGAQWKKSLQTDRSILLTSRMPAAQCLTSFSVMGLSYERRVW